MIYRKRLAWLLCLSPFLLGLYFPWTAAIAVLFLLECLFARCRQGKLCFSGSLLFAATSSMVLFLMLGVFRGTDRGMAPIGALQFLPLPLFVLAIEQVEAEERMHLLNSMPLAASCMVLLSAAMSLIPGPAAWVMVNGRLGGFFQYPNTFALYLLAAMVIRLWSPMAEKEISSGRKGGKASDEKNRKNHAILPALELAVMAAGIILSGSRAVLCLTAAVMILYILQGLRKGREGWLLPGLILLAVIFTLLWSVAGALFPGTETGGASDMSVSSGITGWAATLLGRLLYARDAVPVIMRHPLGLGYMGYASLQGSFQTGVYRVTHVHNELLQLLLDTGWIPALMMLFAIVRSFFSKADTGRRVLIGVICLHCLFDCDTQFPAIGLLLLTAVSAGERGEPGNRASANSASANSGKKQGSKEKTASRAANAAVLSVGVILGASSLWLGTAGLLAYTGNSAAALRVYPLYTTVMVNQLTEAQATGVSETASGKTVKLAERILSLNPSVAAVHDELAFDAFGRGDMETAIREKQKAISLAKYDRVGYEEYADILTTAGQMYRSRGNRETAAACDEELRRIPAMMQDVLDGTSHLGRMIPDQPGFPENQAG